ncbi:MAG: DUF3853 family protein [Paludibacteraceae bacterium]
MTYTIDKNTPLAMVTIGQLTEILGLSEKEPALEMKSERKFVYGLRGIKELFNVSTPTAQRYKDTFLKPAISQQGRKIIVDVEIALELFKNFKNK